MTKVSMDTLIATLDSNQTSDPVLYAGFEPATFGIKDRRSNQWMLVEYVVD